MKINYLKYYIFILALLSLLLPITGGAESSKVWVNIKSHVYHCEGTRWYGKTKRGKFLDEATAISSGNRPARGSYCSKSGRQTINKLSSSASNNVKVWVNTKSHVYHCYGARWYGKTKRGKYISESKAIASGNRPARKQKCN